MQARSIGYELKFPREVVERAAAWIGMAWQSMPRRGGLFWTTTADVALRSIPESNDFSNLFAREGNSKSLWEATRTFHNLTRNGHRIGDTQRADLWQNPVTGSDHDVDFYKLDRDHKVNITALLLSGHMSATLEKLNGNFTLPARSEKDLEFWMSTGVNWYWNNAHAGEQGHKKVPFNTYDSVEYSVRSAIENAWRNLRQNYFEPSEEIKHLNWHTEQKASIPGLRWENTAICAIDAVYTTVNSLDKANDLKTFKTICEKLNDLMVKHRLWEDDSLKPDRASTEGNGKTIPFDKMSPAMKENLTLIVFAALVGISDYTEAEQRRGKRTASEPVQPPKAEDDFALSLKDSGDPQDSDIVLALDDAPPSPKDDFPLITEVTDPTTP